MRSFEKGCHVDQADLKFKYVAKDDIELLLSLPLPPECWVTGICKEH